MRLRLQSSSGKAVLNLDGDESTLGSLRRAIEAKTGVLSGRQLIRTGYPLVEIVGEESEALKSLGISTNETIILEVRPPILNEATNPGSKAAGVPGSTFQKNQAVEYRSADGFWEAATVVDVGLDDELEAFFTILLQKDGREKGTVASRLRGTTPLAAASVDDVAEKDDAGGTGSGACKLPDCAPASVQALLDMGFSNEVALEALSCSHGDLERAVELCCSEKNNDATTRTNSIQHCFVCQEEFPDHAATVLHATKTGHTRFGCRKS